MSSCLYCGSDLPNRGSFCPNCAAQVRCKVCRELLESKAKACVECGTRVEETRISSAGTSSTLDSIVAVQGIPINRLRLEETRTSRSLEAAFTNEAVESLAVPLRSFLTDRGISTPTRHGRTDGRTSDGSVDEADDFVSDGDGPDAPHAPAIQVAALPSGTHQDQMRSIFRYDGDHLWLDRSELKGENKQDTARRLVYLLLYAHELESRNTVARTEILDVLKDAGLFDSNTTKVLNQPADLRTEGDAIGLRLTGRDKAKVYLSAALDPNVPTTWSITAGSGKRVSNRSPKDGDTEPATRLGGKRQIGSAKVVSPWVASWRALGLPIDGHSILSDKPLVDKGIFGLWAIRKASPDGGTEVSRGNLARFLWEAFEIQVDDSALARTLVRNAKGKVAKVKGITFRLLPPGSACAEKMAGPSAGTPSQETVPADSVAQGT